MDTLQFIIQRFDIKKLRAGCNFRGCRRAPTKELLLLEFDRRKPARRIASLYLCERHCSQEANSIPEECRKNGVERHIGGRIYSMPPVTH